MTLAELLEHDPEGRSRFRCPFCEGQNRTLGVDQDTGMYHCFRCHVSGLLGEYREIIRRPITRKRSNEWKRLWDQSQPIRPGVTWRGITNWGPTRYHPSFYGAASVVFPAINCYGRLIGCQSRRARTTYTGSKTMTAKGSVAGLFATGAPSWLTEPLILCEAPLDALSLNEVGYPAMATFGTNLPAWVNRLTWWRRVAIATDADSPGDIAAGKWAEQILCRGIQRLRPEGVKDWNDWLQADREGMKAYLDWHIFKHEGYHPAQHRKG